MQLSDIPDWSAKKFAEDATGLYVRPIPQTTADPAAASMSLGFPPQTFTDEGAGGTPPDGRDFNGILNYLAAWAQWVGLGGPVPYNAAVSSGGGYPKGARVQSATTPPRIWISTTDNNTTNPDAGGAGWISDVSVTYQDLLGAGAGNMPVPSWATHAEVHVVGGGGGGGGATAGKSGGGGGAGGYSWGVISVTPGGSIPYTVGAGGAGGAAGGNGGTGGTSSFGSMTATGGTGATSASSAGGSGGTASGGPRNFTGGLGNDGSAVSNTNPSGMGAAGPFGGSGRSGNPTGTFGTAPGAGGGGGYGVASATGGGGATGAVLIRWLP